MRFSELFESASAPVVSFEVFPPRTDKARATFEKILPRLAKLGPSHMTVTYGAFGSTQSESFGIASKIRSEFDLPTASHLTCVGSTVMELDAILRRIEAEGIQNIVALRGDPPEGEEEFVVTEGGFAHASELVAHIRANYDFGIAVAGYPEKHVEAPDLETDLAFLKQKVDAGADIVITQLFYDNADFHAFEEKARALGITVPIVPGLLPILSYHQIQRITSMCGSKIPAELEQRLQSAGEDADAVADVGIEWSIEQAKGLVERGAPGIHFYVLNRAKHMERIMGGLREIEVV